VQSVTECNSIKTLHYTADNIKCTSMSDNELVFYLNCNFITFVITA